MIILKSLIPLLTGSIVTFITFHIVFNLLLSGDLIFKEVKLKPLKIFLMLLSISFIGSLVITFTNVERSMVNAFARGISCLLVPFQRKNSTK